MEQQKTCSGCGEKGLDGDLIVVYDVNRDEPFGEIEVRAAIDVDKGEQVFTNSEKKKKKF